MIWSAKKKKKVTLYWISSTLKETHWYLDLVKINYHDTYVINSNHIASKKLLPKKKIVSNFFFFYKANVKSLLLKINNNQPILIIFEYEYWIRWETSRTINITIICNFNIRWHFLVPFLSLQLLWPKQVGIITKMEKYD